MIASVLMTLCMYHPTGQIECDVRAKYIFASENQQACEVAAENVVNTIEKATLAANPSFRTLVKKAECISYEVMNTRMNTIRILMEDQGYDYSISFY